MIATRFDSSSEATKIAVARPIPDDPPVIRTTLLRIFFKDVGSTVNVDDILGLKVAASSEGKGVYHHSDIK